MAAAIRSIVRIMAADRLSVRITTAVLRETAVLRQSESSVQPARPVRWVREVLREFRDLKVSLVLQGLLVPKVIPEREDRKAFRVYRVKLAPLGLPVQREILAHRDHKAFRE